MVISFTSKKWFTAFIYVLFLSSAFLSSTLFASQNYPMPSSDKQVVYKEGVINKLIERANLKLHFFYPPNYNAESDKRPAIVFFFGGGWNTGGPEQFYRQSRHLASLGMVAISAEYRISSKHVIWDTKKNKYVPSTPRESAKDAKSVMRWVRANAEEYGINPDMIAAGGASAGGQLAAMTATSDIFNAADDPNKNISERPNALVLFNPVIDNGPGEYNYGYDRVKSYWEFFSPIHNLVNPKLAKRQDGDQRPGPPPPPPTIILTGSNDNTAKLEVIEKYKSIMDRKGIRCDLIVYDGEIHSFFNAKKSEKMYEDTLERTVQFLASLGYIPSLENIPRSCST